MYVENFIYENFFFFLYLSSAFTEIFQMSNSNKSFQSIKLLLKIDWFIESS